MKESFIKKNVMQVEEILSLYILLINPTLFIIKVFGGLINGMLLITEKTLIFPKVFLSNLAN